LRKGLGATAAAATAVISGSKIIILFLSGPFSIKKLIVFSFL
jgi:hypothetical protein